MWLCVSVRKSRYDSVLVSVSPSLFLSVRVSVYVDMSECVVMGKRMCE